jgi:teichuronic acid exporter
MGTLRKALFWSAMQRFGLRGTGFLLSIILARLLSPKEYGLVGMLLVFCGIGQVFADSGLSTALVQRQANSADDEATVFYLNIGAGVALTLLICAISPLVAKFYGQPILIPLLCVLSLQVVLSSFGIVQGALLTRAMDFRRLAIISTLSVLSSGAVGIGMALHGLGVWSLAGQSVSGALFNSLLVWRLGKWRLTGHFRRASFQSMWSFSSRLLTAGIVGTVFGNIYDVIIGRLYSPADLGFFTRARSIALFPAGFVASILSQTTLPAFARITDDVTLLKSSFRRVIRMCVVVHFPAMTAIAVVADPLVRFLLTDKWAPCVPYLQVLSVECILAPLHILHLNVLMAQGRSDLFLRLEIVKKVFIILAIACTFRFGIYAMVWGILGTGITLLAVNGYYTRKLLDYRWREQALDLAPALGASVVMGMLMSSIFYLKFENIGAWLLHIKINNPLTLLLVQLAVGLAVYGCIAGLSRMSTYVEFRSLVFSYFGLGSERRAGGDA